MVRVRPTCRRGGGRGNGERSPGLGSLSPADPKLTSCACFASICGDEARCVRTESAYCACHWLPHGARPARMG